MELDKAVEGMLLTRNAMRSKRGIDDAGFISEQMQRLTQYTGAVEEHLAVLEKDLEVEEMEKFLNYTKVEGRTINQAEILAKQEVSETKGEIAKLRRFVNSSWSVIGVAQSRINHLNKQGVGQI